MCSPGDRINHEFYVILIHIPHLPRKLFFFLFRKELIVQVDNHPWICNPQRIYLICRFQLLQCLFRCFHKIIIAVIKTHTEVFAYGTSAETIDRLFSICNWDNSTVECSFLNHTIFKYVHSCTNNEIGSKSCVTT